MRASALRNNRAGSLAVERPAIAHVLAVMLDQVKA
jgi:hypothetical protein